MIYVGIDNGLDGGITALSPHGLIINKWVMPTMTVIQPARKTTKEKKLREIDTLKLFYMLGELGSREQFKVIFEHCPFHADRASTMRSMAMTAGKILGLLETRGVETHRVLHHDWHPSILGEIPQGKTKRYAYLKANELWGDECWLATKRHRTPHDGMVDAALIAEYGRRLEL